jgi:hypothetical protein
MTAADMQALVACQITAAEQCLAYGYAIEELRANTAIIGELTAAIALGGTLSPNNNERGWDVEGADGLKYQVKTYTVNRHGRRKVKASTAHLADITLCYLIRAIDGKIVIEQTACLTRAEVLATPVFVDGNTLYHSASCPRYVKKSK